MTFYEKERNNFKNQKKISELFDLTIVTKFKFKKKYNFKVIKMLNLNQKPQNLFKKTIFFFSN